MRLRLVANVHREQSKLDGLLANIRERFPLLNAGLLSQTTTFPGGRHKFLT